MCFSATASFVSGVALTGAGALAVKKSEKKRDLPFASIPFLFGIQQFIEGFVWLSFQYGFIFVNQVATYLFVFFAYIVWPIFVPFSVRLLEENPVRRKLLLGIQYVGLFVGSYLLFYIVNTPISSTVIHNSLAYTSPKEYGVFLIGLYVIATCGSCLVSSHRIVKLLGLLTFLSLLIAYYFYMTSYVSVWCFFAAVLSLVVYRHTVVGEHERNT